MSTRKHPTWFPVRSYTKKVTEGITEYPWHAQHETGYCEAVAEKLVIKLQTLDERRQPQAVNQKSSNAASQTP
ncbi:MAG: hypothetical protein OSB45_06140 [Pseudomonadales bacterium]|nr:hypothetical protein [Pseudomonadales bacterium]